MSSWQDLQALLEMYSSGGLVIMTGMDGAVAETAVSPSSTYNGKTYTHTGIRTTIQLDSDYVTIMSTAVMQQPDIWQKHVSQVEAKLAILKTLQVWAQRSWLLFMLIPLAWYGYDFYDLREAQSIQEAWFLLYPTLLSGAVVVGRRWLLRGLQATMLPLTSRMVRWFAQRQFKQFVEDME
ncbi:MAG: hypothetical protein CSB13_09780 [Chloroflexi bacterium]|nr:MAG: hypothetical protein CSB13_09780 [Chloroflexota bacterium]